MWVTWHAHGYDYYGCQGNLICGWPGMHMVMIIMVVKET